MKQAVRGGELMEEFKTGNPMVPAARKDGEVLYATIAGEIDLNNSPSLRTTLFDLAARHSPKRMVLNLAQVPYMDSSAIAVLVELMRRLRGGKIALADLQPRVRGLLEIARLDTIFAIVQNEGPGNRANDQ
jgi:anti-sigma B factor antagonist